MGFNSGFKGLKVLLYISERLLLSHIVLKAKAHSGAVRCSDADGALCQERT